jgi:hypothetical protein
MAMNRRGTYRPGVGARRTRLVWNWERIVLWFAVLAMAGATVAVLGTGVRLALHEPGSIIDGLPPCATEDSDNCYWDATAHGNGRGLSFASIDGEVIPWCTDAIIASEAACWGPRR